MFNLLSEILHYSVWSLVIGLLAAVACVLLIFIAARACNRGKAVVTPAGFAALGLLLVMLPFQTVPMCGAIALRWKTDEVRVYAQNAVDTLYPVMESTSIITEEQAAPVIDRILADYPVIQSFIDIDPNESVTLRELPSAIAESVDSSLAAYMWRRIGWAALFILTAAAVTLLTLGSEASVPYRRGRSSTSGSRSNPALSAAAGLGRQSRPVRPAAKHSTGVRARRPHSSRY